jgi:quercetin dioxygenase-like cupin family protein
MIRSLVVLGVLAWAGAASAQAPQPGAGTAPTPQMTCSVVLPAAPIPGDPRHYFSIERITVAAGHTGHQHDHDAVEYLQAVSGTGRLLVQGHPDVALSPGVASAIPPHVPHQIINGSTTEPLVFTASFVGPLGDQKLTHYDGERDSQSGCPHQIAKRH